MLVALCQVDLAPKLSNLNSLHNRNASFVKFLNSPCRWDANGRDEESCFVPDHNVNEFGELTRSVVSLKSVPIEHWSDL
jgi:hypothetical protein